MATAFPLPTDAQLSDESRALLARRAAVGVYRMAAWSPALHPPFMALVTALFDDTVLDAKVREAVILRVAMHEGSAYEAHHHRGLALDAGLAADEVRSLLTDAHADLGDPRLETAVEFTDALFGPPGALEPLRARIQEEFGPRGAAELALLAGAYRMVATLIAATGLVPESQTASQLRAAIRHPD